MIAEHVFETTFMRSDETLPMKRQPSATQQLHTECDPKYHTTPGIVQPSNIDPSMRTPIFCLISIPSNFILPAYT